MSAAEKLELEELKSVQEATRPPTMNQPPAATQERLERAVAGLQRFSTLDAASALKTKVGTMRAQLPVLENILTNLAYVGRDMMADAKAFPDLARELETLLPSTCEKIRTVRALSMIYLQQANDDLDALARAQAIIAAHGAKVAATMTPEELGELSAESRPDPAELEAWLNTP